MQRCRINNLGTVFFLFLYSSSLFPFDLGYLYLTTTNTYTTPGFETTYPSLKLKSERYRIPSSLAPQKSLTTVAAPSSSLHPPPCFRVN
ncbi:hypothetical protein F4810DRAFT_118471 [Camillea tinctor]|nr:hypothetical protein F4810DRAFT_118471 [Camillea tinctor]